MGPSQRARLLSCCKHVNNDDHSQVFHTIPFKEFGDYTVADLWVSLPRDNKGILKGAAFPVVLLLDWEEVFPVSNEGDDDYF